MFNTFSRFLHSTETVTKPHEKREPPTPRRILVVDDEEPIRKLVDRVLSGVGYKTALAADGVEALQVATELGAFDLLVTDLMMPQMSGDDLARRLLSAQPQLKVLYLTGHSERLFKNRVMLGENEAFLDKPFSVDGLRGALALIAPVRPETGERFLV